MRPQLFSVILGACLIFAVACVTTQKSSTDPSVTEYLRGDTIVAQETDAGIVVTPEGQERGYRVEMDPVDGTPILAGGDAENFVMAAKPWLPAPLTPFLPLIGAGVARLASKRGKRKAKDAFRNIVQGKFAEATNDVFGYMGFSDSNPADVAYMKLRDKLVREGRVDPDTGLPFELTNKRAPHNPWVSVPNEVGHGHRDSLGAVGPTPDVVS